MTEPEIEMFEKLEKRVATLEEKIEAATLLIEALLRGYKQKQKRN